MRSASSTAPLSGGRRQQQREFLAADAGGQVVVAHALLQHARHRHQHLVAEQVAVGVVDQLEVVDVDQHQRHRRLAIGQVLGDVLLEGAAVVQAGQAVGLRLAARSRYLGSQLRDLALVHVEATLQLAHRLRHLARAVDHALQHRAAVGLAIELGLPLRQRLVEGRGAIGRLQRVLLHAAQDAARVLGDPLRGLEPDRRDIGLEQPRHVGLGQRAAVGGEPLDLGLQVAAAAGHVLVPDRVVDGVQSDRMLGHLREREPEKFAAPLDTVGVVA